MNSESSSTGMVVGGIVIIVVIAIGAGIAYTQGFFRGQAEVQDARGLEIQLGGTTDGDN